MIDSRELLQLWQPASAGRKPYYKKNSTLSTPHQDFRPETSFMPEAGQGMPEFGDYPPMALHGESDYATSEPYFAQPPAYSPSPAAPAGKPGKFGRKPFAPASAPRRPAGRIVPASREDRVLRLLLTDPQSWDRLSTEEHHLLLALPAPHGPLFAWLESQLHEHGPQSWAVLREGLRGHAHEHHAVAQFAEVLEGVDYDWDETRRILAQLQQLKRDSEIAELAARAPHEPAVLERLRELLAQSRAGKTPPKPA